jgi:hypothetical protein
MQDLANSTLAEQNRQIIALLAKIEKQGRAPTVEELRVESPEIYEYLKFKRIASASLGEVIETDMAVKGYTDISLYVRDQLTPKPKPSGESMQAIVDRASGKK